MRKNLVLGIQWMVDLKEFSASDKRTRHLNITVEEPCISPLGVPTVYGDATRQIDMAVQPYANPVHLDCTFNSVVGRAALSARNSTHP